MSSSSTADDAEEFSLRGSFKQSVVSKDGPKVVQHSTRPLVAHYNGTWKQCSIAGLGSSGIVYEDRKDISGQVRAVKKITSGRPQAIELEIECMICVKEVSQSIPSLLTSLPLNN